MSENRSYTVRYHFKNRTGPINEPQGTLSIVESSSQFIITSLHGKKAEHFKSTYFETFAKRPFSSTATQFDIPFVQSDPRGALHLKFSSAADLLSAYNRLRPMFAKTDELSNQRKIRGMLQSSSAGGNLNSTKNGSLNSYYVNSPGAPVIEKRKRTVFGTSTLQQDCSFTEPPIRRKTEDFTNSTPRFIPGFLSSSSCKTNNNNNNNSCSDYGSNKLVTSPVSSGRYSLLSPASNLNVTPISKRTILASRSPPSKSIGEEDLFLDNGSSYNSPPHTVLPINNWRYSDSPWWYRSFGNIGNSCYMNSILQLVFYTSGISIRLNRLMAVEHLYNSSKMLQSLSALNSRMSSLKQEGQREYSRFSLKESLRQIREISGRYLDSNFGTSAQQDAHELWTKLLDFTNEEIKKYHTALYGGDENDNGERSQNNENVNGSAPITFNNLLSPGDLFKVQLITRLGCNECSNVRESQVEELFDINLDISDETELVSELVRKYLDVEVIDFACDRCRNVKANKSQAVKVFPTYLVFVIKRYRYNMGNEKKKTTHISVERDLFLNNVHVGSEEKQKEKRDLCNSLEETNETFGSSLPKSPFKEVLNTLNTHGDGNSNRSLEIPSELPLRHASAELIELAGVDNDLDLNGNDVDSSQSDELMDCSSPTSGQMNVSPINNSLSEQQGNAGDNNLDWLAVTQPVIVSKVRNNETSKTYFKPLTEQESDRIRSELGKTMFFAKSEWHYSTFSPECELSSNEAIDLGSVTGDGNCLFRSLSWWLFNGNQSHHSDLRQKITAFATNFRTEFAALLEEDGQMEDHLRKMFEDGEWGTQVELSAAATMFRCPIYTYHDSSWKVFPPLFAVCFDKDTLSYAKDSEPPKSYDIVTDGAIYLSNEDNHYDPVKGKQFQSNAGNLDPPEPAYVYNENDGPVYTLTGVVNHIGTSMTCGHYKAMVYDEPIGVWVSCDDSYVNAISETQVLEEAGRNGYMLVYKKRTPGDEMEFTHSTAYLNSR